MSSPRIVILPGSGSDEVFIRAAFGPAARAIGAELLAPAPRPGAGLLAGYRAALDEAASAGPILVGGVSLGAHLAAEWALRDPERCTGLVAALPGWLGSPGGAPAAAAARASADAVNALGLEDALAHATADVPAWLATQLRRSWPRYGDALAESLLLAAESTAPDTAELADCQVPSVVIGCLDDPVHPFGTARAWAEAIPGAELRTVRLAELGADPAVLGRLGLTQASEAPSAPPSPSSTSPETQR